MSDMGAIMDALATASEGAVAGLTAERGLRRDIDKSEKPRLFLFSPVESLELAEHLQEITTTNIEGLLYADVTQEVMAGYLDDVRDAVRADKTLGSVVRWAYVAARGIDEHTDAVDRVGVMTFVTVQEA